MFFIIVQAIGFIGIFLNIISVQYNTHRSIMIFKTLGSLMFVIHYFLLGAYPGMVMDTIGIIRNIVFTELIKRDKPTKKWIIFFFIITLILGVVTIYIGWNDILVSMSFWTENAKLVAIMAVGVSLLSIIAKSLTTVAYGLKEPHRIRMINLPSSVCWLIYNSVCRSLSGAINEIFVLSSIAVAEIRFRKKKD